MEDFFDALANLTEGVTIQDLNSLFSNNNLDQIYQEDSVKSREQTVSFIFKQL